MKILKQILVAVLLMIAVSNSAYSQNKALEFDGVDDKLTIKFNPDEAPINNYTYEVWVKPKGSIKISKMENKGISGTRSQHYLIFPQKGKSLGKNGTGSGLSVGSNGVVVNEHADNYMPSLLAYQRQLSEWTHIAVVYTEKQAVLYINGSFATRGLLSTRSHVHFIPTEIGSNAAKYGNYVGMIDELRVWNRSLSPLEINNNYKNSLRGDEKGLILYYDFNQMASNGTIKDISGNNHTGFLAGGTRLVDNSSPIKILPKGPPKLHVEVHYQDSDGNGILEKSNTGQIIVSVTNENDVAIKKVDISLKCLTTDQGDGLISFKSVDRDDNSPNYKETFEIKNIESPKADSLKFEITIECTANNSKYGSVDPYVLYVSTQDEYSMPKRPADIYIEDLVFNEPSGNKALDGYESGNIEFTLKNKGLGKAQNINIALSPLLSDKNLFYSKEKVVEVVESKSSYSVSIPISAEGNVETLNRSIRIQANEEFGFDADPIILNFETVAFNPPNLRIEKIAINDREEGDAYGNGNSTIESNESIVVSAFVQNFGSGTAEDVKATVMLESSDRNISCPDQGREIALGDILPGEYKPVEFYFFTSKRYSQEDIPLKIQITESKGDYGKKINLGLKMNTRTDNIIDVNIAKIDIPKAEIKEIEGFSKSDIDEVLVKSKTVRSSSLSVIIGIEDYKYASSASYASRDAGAFYQYATKILGIPDANVYYLVDDGATVGEFSKLFDENGWLSRRVTENSDIFVFYSGHGAPDIKTKVPYVIPYDIDPNYAQNGYSSYQLYKNLGALNAKSVTVMLDACFSGQNKENEMLLAGARPALLEVAESAVPSNVTLLSASSANQISSGYPSEKHGIFSYYLMKGMSVESDINNDGKITLGELYDYLYGNVKSTAGRLDREQTPELVNGNRDQVICEF